MRGEYNRCRVYDENSHKEKLDFIDMASQSMLYLIFLHSLFLTNAFEFNPSDYELYGSTLAANGQFIVAMQNRTAFTFSAVINYTSDTPTYCTVDHTPSGGGEFYATMLAVGRNSAIGSNSHKFVFTYYSQNQTRVYLVVASIQFSPACSLTSTHTEQVANGTNPTYAVLGVDSDSKLAFYFYDDRMFLQNLNTFAKLPSQKWINVTADSIFPSGIDLMKNWGVLAVFRRNASGTNTAAKFRPLIYRINFLSCLSILTASCLQLTLVQSISYPFSWQASKTPSNTATGNEYDSLYDMSVSINDQDKILIGIQSINTVFGFSNSTSLTAYGSRIPSTIASVGFGKSVGWLDNNTAAVLMNNFSLDYAQWRSSRIELYPINSSSSLSNSIAAYASYPNAHQQIWPTLNSRLIDMIAVPDSGSVIYMDFNGAVHVVRPSPAAYFANTYNGAGEASNTIYIAPTLRCPSGTLKNQSAYGKDLFWYCLLCQEGTFYSPNRSNLTDRCAPCDTSRYFCPWGAVAEMPVSVLDIVTQAYVYPQSPENDGFEDILLLNMFNIDFPAHCLAKQPLFYGIIIIGVGCMFLAFMGILKLTGKLKKHRRMMKSIFKQTDLIGEGELWIGGVASFAIIVISIFAYRFSSQFMHQYPIETSPDATFACDPTLRNAKFSTSMQSLGTPLLEQEQPLFDMLDSQPFTLNVALINTDFTADQLQVAQVLGSIRVSLPFTTTQSEGILYVSTNVTSHTTTVQFTVLSASSVGALRVGLTGPAIEGGDYQVKELNFSYAFNHTNRTVAQDPVITVHLIKLVNETEPLASDGDMQYSGIWIPTFVKSDEQLFITESDFQLYHIYDRTVFTVQLTEATYYIFNKQEPITKLTEVIFTDILFTTMCIELFALTFLFFKLAVLPIVKMLLRLCFKSNKVRPKNKRAGVCPNCRSVNGESLPSHRVAVQRALNNAAPYPIRRH